MPASVSTVELLPEWRESLHVLKRRGVRFLLVGAHALAAPSRPRYTQDLDVLVDGVGAPPRQVLCIGTTPPAGLVTGGYDEDDTDPTVIETEDFDDLLDLIVLGG